MIPVATGKLGVHLECENENGPQLVATYVYRELGTNDPPRLLWELFGIIEM